MFARVFVASCFVVTGSIASEARPLRTALSPECNVTMPCDQGGSQARRERTALPARQSQPLAQRAALDSYAMADANVARAQTVGGRPSSCPRSFCGCGAAIRVFGRIVPELNLASNWLRFPRTSPAPGMVAARHGHVFVLEQHLGGDMWMAYDANSGGHATRLHARSLRGYAVVNPRG